MKKLLLMTMVGLSTASAFAQSQNSVVFTKHVNTGGRYEDATIKPISHNNGNKTTAGAGEWFSYVNIMADPTTAKGYVRAVAPDSNIKVTYSNGAFNISTHGFGVSFDPTDSVFKGYEYDQTKAGTIPSSNLQYLPSFAVYSGNSYTVDSIGFPFKYYMNDATATTDSLFIDVIRATKGATGQTPGVQSFTFTTTGENAVSPIINPLNGMLDSAVAVGADRVQIKVPLNAAFAADTNTNGLSKFTTNGLALKNASGAATTMSLNANQALVIYVYVKLQKTYPLNTPNTAANYGRTNEYDLDGTDGPASQSGGSYYTTLTTTNQTTYNGINPTDPKGFRPLGHNTAIPATAYTSASLLDFDVKVTCSSCVPAAVRDINKNVFGVSAYPNPANNELTIKFNQKTAAAATVSITNTVGQVLSTQTLGTVNGASAATFSTANLANGLYFFTIESNGQRTTERFVVAH